MRPATRPVRGTGTGDYRRRYSLTAKAQKARSPDPRVDGPGEGNTGRLAGARLTPPPFLARFPAHCLADRTPLDFLDRELFTAAERHLNEWNHLPRNDWAGMLASAPDA